MHSLLVNGGQLVGALAGFFLIVALARSDKTSPLLLWGVTAACTAAMAAFMFPFTEPGFAWNDFRNAYWQGAVDVIDGGPQALASHYGAQPLKFVNLPIVVYLFTPLTLVQAVGVSAWGAAKLYTAIGVVAMVGVWFLLGRLYRLGRTERAVTLFALAVYGPLVYSFREGNSSHFLVLAILLAILLFRQGRHGASGALLGLAVVIKPPLLLIGVFFALRGRWRVALGGLAAVAATGLLSILIFGWDMHVLWYTTSVAPFLGHPVPGAHSVQTIPSFVLRFILPHEELHTWTPHTLGPLAKAVVYALTAAFLAAVGWIMMRAPRLLKPTDADVEHELLALLVTICFLVTSSWGHYYVWAIPGFVWAMTQTRPGSPGAGLRPALIACFVLATPAVFASPAMRAGDFGIATNWLTSHLLYAGVGLALLLVRLRALQPGRVAAASAPATA